MTHLSLQLVAFPWFTRQVLHSLGSQHLITWTETLTVDVKHDLYRGVAFPRVPKPMSTDRAHPAYAKFLMQLLHTNLKRFDHVYLDLHAVVRLLNL